MPDMSLVGITNPEAFVAATNNTVLAATALASGTLAGGTWLVLSARLRLLTRTHLHFLLNFSTGLLLALVLGLVAGVYEAVFDPWHHVSFWCSPPPPFFRYFLLGVPVLTTTVHAVVHRSRRPT